MKFWPLKNTIVCLLLALLTFAVYSPVLKNDFVNYDDPLYVTENTFVNKGISLEGIKWALTRSHQANWHPLTWMSHMVDCEIFGMEPHGHHLTNLIIHIINVLLLFVLLNYMTGSAWPSAFVSVLFAIHPLHVESVAWISERKDVLSAFFFMLTLLCYAWYVNKKSVFRYFTVIVFYILGLMSKPMLVTVPFVLLLLDYWPLERFGLDNAGALKKNIWLLVKEKTPLFVLTFVACAATYANQKNASATDWMIDLSVTTRMLNAVASYAAYLGKAVAPSGFGVMYPYPIDGIGLSKVIVSAVVLVVITGAVLYCFKSKRFLAIGWFWYLGMLVPVIGFVQVGAQAIADRYTYLPLIGFYMMCVWFLWEVLSAQRHLQKWIAVGCCLAIGSLSLLTFYQAGIWKDSSTLFEHTLKVTENNYIIHNNLGNVYREAEKLDAAVEQFRRSLDVTERFPQVYYNYGFTLYLKGDISSAVSKWEQSLKLDSNYVDSLNNLAWVFATRKQTSFYDPQKAIGLSLRSCQLTANIDPEKLDTLAVAYAATGDFKNAIAISQQALQAARALNDTDNAREIASRLALFKAGVAYVEP